MARHNGRNHHLHTTLTRPAQNLVNVSGDSAETVGAMQVQPRSLRHQDTPGRWESVLARAQQAGVKVYELGHGQYAVSSAHTSSKLYEVTTVPETCSCPAALSGDPVCIHRAIVREYLRPQPEPPAHAAFDPTEEALRWAEDDLKRAYNDLQRYSDRINRGDVPNERECSGFLQAQER